MGRNKENLIPGMQNGNANEFSFVPKNDEREQKRRETLKNKITGQSINVNNINNISRGSMKFSKNPVNILDDTNMSFQIPKQQGWIPQDLVEFGQSLETDEDYEAYRLLMLTRLHTMNLQEEVYEELIRMDKN